MCGLLPFVDDENFDENNIQPILNKYDLNVCMATNFGGAAWDLGRA